MGTRTKKPTIVIVFENSLEPHFQFRNWENGGVSQGKLEEMTHKLFQAAHQAQVKVRRDRMIEDATAAKQSGMSAPN